MRHEIITPNDVILIKKLHLKKISISEIARRLNVDRTVIYYWLKKDENAIPYVKLIKKRTYTHDPKYKPTPHNNLIDHTFYKELRKKFEEKEILAWNKHLLEKVEKVEEIRVWHDLT